MNDHNLRIVVSLHGDIDRELGNRIKYNYFIQALTKKAIVVDVYNAALQGFDRWLNTLLVFHPNRQIWKQRFYKNIPAFRRKSYLAAQHISRMEGQVDAVIQLGVLFDTFIKKTTVPGFIYTDYTAHLSAQKPNTERSPFRPNALIRWLELEKRTYDHAKHIFARSKMVRESIIQDYQIEPGKVSVVGGGANFDPLPSIRDRFDNGVPTALFIGKNFYRKGGDLLLKAFSQVRKDHPSARLLMLTSGPVPTGLPLDGVELIQPTWDREFIRSLFKKADLLVLPSRLETWGDVLLEAMAYALPCVGVASDAMDEIIIHSETGLITRPGSVNDLADALNFLFSQPELGRKWGVAGRQQLEERFTWEIVADKLIQTIKPTAVMAK